MSISTPGCRTTFARILSSDRPVCQSCSRWAAAWRRCRRPLRPRLLRAGASDRRLHGGNRQAAVDVLCRAWRSTSRCSAAPANARSPSVWPLQSFRWCSAPPSASSFGYPTIPAIVIGSLLASHTLLGLPAIDRLGLNRLEPVTVAVGATVMSDTLSLVVFAVCVSIYTPGSRRRAWRCCWPKSSATSCWCCLASAASAAYILKKVEDEEDAYFVLMLCIMAVAGVLADAIQLPGIVGAFLAGLAVNASARDKPASAKLEFLGKSLFIPIFFIVTGFLINPVTFVPRTFRQLPACRGHHRRPPRRQMDCCVGCGPRIRLHPRRATDGLVTDIAAGRRNARRDAGRTRHAGRRRSAPARRSHAQRGPGAGARDVDPRPGADRALRASIGRE